MRENRFYGVRAGQVCRVSCWERRCRFYSVQKLRTRWKLKAGFGDESAHVLVFAACMCSLIGA